MRIIFSFRFQLFGAIFFASVIPAFVRQNFRFDFFSSTNQIGALTGTAAAIVVGYFFHRKLTVFPGVKADYYIIPIYAASYAILILGFFLTRLDYTRTTVVSSFLIAIVWFHFLGFAVRRVRPYSLAIVPGGDVETLSQIADVRWITLTDPEMPRRSWSGLVADLRADLSDEWVRFISETAVSGTPVFHVKQIRESLTGQVEIEHLSENTLGSLNPNEAYRELKHTLDWVVALLGLLILFPIFMVVAVAIKLDSHGPVLFQQERRGYRGAVFKVLKFRTMIADAKPHSSERVDDLVGYDAREEARTKDRDTRITRIGKTLRRTRLDELPQIINILRGEMSWIGPRPEALVLSDWYESELPFYNYRHIVHPGITGWAQVNQGHVSAVRDVHEKLHFDFYYIKNFSFWLDLMILMRTVRTVLTGFGSR